MSIHNQHENMPIDAVLADNCPRCEEHAMNPFMSLDDSHLARLYHVIVKQEEGIIVNIPTQNDLIAIGKIKDVVNSYKRLERAYKGYYSVSEILKRRNLQP